MEKQISKSILYIKVIICCTLIMFDFILSFIGIQMGFIVEGNPFLIGFFNLDFFSALFIRFGVALVIFTLFTLSIKLATQSQVRFVTHAINLSVAINIFVLILHIRWLLLAQSSFIN